MNLYLTLPDGSSVPVSLSVPDGYTLAAPAESHWLGGAAFASWNGGGVAYACRALPPVGPGGRGGGAPVRPPGAA